MCVCVCLLNFTDNWTSGHMSYKKTRAPLHLMRPSNQTRDWSFIDSLRGLLFNLLEKDCYNIIIFINRAGYVFTYVVRHAAFSHVYLTITCTAAEIFSFFFFHGLTSRSFILSFLFYSWRAVQSYRTHLKVRYPICGDDRSQCLNWRSPSWSFPEFPSVVRQMPGDLCTVPGITSLSPLSSATHVTNATLGASGLWLKLLPRPFLLLSFLLPS